MIIKMMRLLSHLKAAGRKGTDEAFPRLVVHPGVSGVEPDTPATSTSHVDRPHLDSVSPSLPITRKFTFLSILGEGGDDEEEMMR